MTTPRSHAVTYRGVDDAAVIGEFARDAARAAEQGWKPVVQAWTTEAGQRALAVTFQLDVTPARSTPSRSTPEMPVRSRPRATAATSWSPALPGSNTAPKPPPPPPAAGNPGGLGTTWTSTGGGSTAGGSVSRSHFAVRWLPARLLLRGGAIVFFGSLVAGMFLDPTSRIYTASVYTFVGGAGIICLALAVEGLRARSTRDPSIYRHSAALGIFLILALICFGTVANGFSKLLNTA